MCLVDDQEPVEEFAADRPDEALGDRVGRGCRAGVRMVRASMAVITASKAAVNLASRSPIRMRRIDDLARLLAAAVDPDGFSQCARAGGADRRVPVGAGVDGMADLRAHLPVKQAVALPCGSDDGGQRTGGPSRIPLPLRGVVFD